MGLLYSSVDSSIDEFIAEYAVRRRGMAEGGSLGG